MKVHYLYYVVLITILILQLQYSTAQKTYRSTLEKTLQGATSVGRKITDIFIPKSIAASLKSNDSEPQGFSAILNKFKSQVRAIVPGLS